jgi:serine/threonine protein kinase
MEKVEEKKTTFDPNDYVEMLQIGQGNFSEMLLVEHKDTKILYAMKVFNKMRVEQLKKQQDVLMEKHVMNKIIPHNNLIRCYGSNKNEVIISLQRCSYIFYMNMSMEANCGKSLHIMVYLLKSMSSIISNN